MLFEDIRSLPGVHVGPSHISVPGARGFTLKDGSADEQTLLVPQVGERHRPEHTLPARVADAGPRWDDPATTTDTAHAVDVAALEAEHAVDGQRLQLQPQPAKQLTAEGRPVTSLSVLQRAVELLHANPW